MRPSVCQFCTCRVLVEKVAELCCKSVGCRLQASQSIDSDVGIIKNGQEKCQYMHNACGSSDPERVWCDLETQFRR